MNEKTIIKDLNTVYRPETWESFKGQSKVVEALKSQVLTKAGLSNSYIFHGESGTGKTTMARMFFKAISCTNVGKDGNSCLKCGACKDVRGGLNPLREVDTTDIGVKEIRDIIRSAGCKMFSDACLYRGILLDECHMLKKPSWNALLKTIEEESDKTIWFFVTTEFDAIPKTIKTRCQLYEFKACKAPEIIERLKEIVYDQGVEFSDYELQKITQESDGSPRQAIHILEQRIAVKLWEK